MADRKSNIVIGILIILGLLTALILAGCKDLIKDPAESDDSGNHVLMSVAELKASTFIDLDFDKFPQLPENKIPAANVIFVSPSGNDSTGNGSEASPFRSIARAINSAVSGSTIVISAGTYAEESSDGDYRALMIDQDNITLMAKPDEDVNLVPANNTVTYGLNISANGFTIRGIKIRGFDLGIICEDTTVKNLVIADCAVYGASEGIATWNGTINNLLAYNVLIKDSTLIGIHCGNGYGNNWRLEKCNIDMKSGASGSGADAFAIEHGDNILLVNCVVSGASADGIDTKATRVVVYGCTVNHIGRNGIKLWHGGDVINCLVHHTGADAAIVVERGDVRILNTTMGFHNYQESTSYNMTFGYDAREKMKIQLINSVFFNTSGGAWMTPNSDLSISHCLFYGIENGKILDYGDTSIMISQGSNGLSVFGPGNLVANPLLKEDFHPQPNSPIINAGITLSSQFPRKDMNGNSRIKNGKPDLGPFEDY